MSKTRTMLEIERRRGEQLEVLLPKLYERHGSQAAVANDLGIDSSTLSIWLIRLRLEQHTILRERAS